jgi:hypothetical protein
LKILLGIKKSKIAEVLVFILKERDWRSQLGGGSSRNKLNVAGFACGVKPHRIVLRP